MSEIPVATMSFEEAMKALEEVVNQLDQGDVALDRSIELYERGAALKKRCEDELRRAEEKVAAITLDGEGNPTGLRPLGGEGNDAGQGGGGDGRF
ncbi:exodeoxyribonuclease VII small subunit [Pontibaca methylaminivorans]|uniref:Exodeoxyribonuclease 7 small subunit n=1 Tax=Pontibaca methylaminivorans TaxID=515897 RepID=A0A1R3WJT8_9RHOB|nr:exodeoxyribonuclease VII small subunit [Pontibaca methylaminivorans]SIT76883.1 Exodeoxyribonuclease VII small subunit [Pontibaca methylaminivorans]